MKEKKTIGQVFTPAYLVSIILDFANYTIWNINRKHIIDHSCWNWAFLVEVVKRYCDDFLKTNSNLNQLKSELESFIHGIEIEEKAYQECLKNLSEVASLYWIININWKIIHWDSLVLRKQFEWKMDFVVGNPPYVRIHNIGNQNIIKQFWFSKTGMTDLFIIFFEIWFKMLNKSGLMSIITPSSRLASKAWATLRTYILKNKNMSGIIDLGHYQAFPATTYTLISRFHKNHQDKVFDYLTYNGKLNYENKLTLDNIHQNDAFYLGSLNDLEFLRQIYNSQKKHNIKTKNGFATLADNVFIGKLPFQELTIKVIKASTWEWKQCLYPYDKEGELLDLDLIKTKYPTVFNYLQTHKERLLDRKYDIKRYWFGRSQAIQDVQLPKIVINTLIKDTQSIKIWISPAGSWVYSWLYILSDRTFEEIKSLLIHNDFIKYLKILKKYKSWWYYTFSSKDLSYYLNYKLQKNE